MGITVEMLRMQGKVLLGSISNRWSITLLGAILLAAGGTVGLLRFQSAQLTARLMREDPDLLLSNPQLTHYAESVARPVYLRHCASCHGSNLEGNHNRGAPRLNDNVWLYDSGRVIEIEQLIRFGIRSGEPRSPNITDMPAFGRTGKLTSDQVRNVVAYVLSLSGATPDPKSVAQGRSIFSDQGACWDCHREDGKGNSAYGAPDLTDSDWLYGSSEASIFTSVYDGRHGICPAWNTKLDPIQIRALAVYLNNAARARS
jgi:cytochrome c oxidase cbb3-type subunit 3